uniref:Uncharacterized protein n=1 Tax=Lepeophtheirus salmonis TaxID=72036 RepID=A0A0K2SWL5_LEPSM
MYLVTFVVFLVTKQTNGGRNITSLADVINQNSFTAICGQYFNILSFKIGVKLMRIISMKDS